MSWLYGVVPGAATTIIIVMIDGVAQYDLWALATDTANSTCRSDPRRFAIGCCQAKPLDRKLAYPCLWKSCTSPSTQADRLWLAWHWQLQRMMPERELSKAAQMWRNNPDKHFRRKRGRLFLSPKLVRLVAYPETAYFRAHKSAACRYCQPLWSLDLAATHSSIVLGAIAMRTFSIDLTFGNSNRRYKFGNSNRRSSASKASVPPSTLALNQS